MHGHEGHSREEMCHHISQTQVSGGSRVDSVVQWCPYRLALVSTGPPGDPVAAWLPQVQVVHAHRAHTAPGSEHKRPFLL